MENNVKCKKTLLNCYIVTLLWIERNRHSRLAGEAGQVGNDKVNYNFIIQY